MPWITPEPKQAKEALTLKMDVTVLRQLARYAVFLGSSQSYVVAEILRDVFSRDKDFQAWLREHENADDETDAAAEGVPASRLTSARHRTRPRRAHRHSETPGAAEASEEPAR